MHKETSPAYCAYPWQQMIIDLTGEVVPCCFWSGYGNSGKPLGNTNLNTIEEIWNGSEYQALRRANATGKLEGHPCNQCVSYAWSNGRYPSFSSPIRWRKESGYCYVVEIPETFVSLAGDALSQAEVLENGIPLAFSKALHDEIRNIGMGRYSVWGHSLYFSSSDNSDPSETGKLYELSLPAGRVKLQSLVIDSVSGKNIREAKGEYETGVSVMSAKPSMISLISTADCNIDCPNCSQNLVRAAHIQHRSETVPDILSHVPYLYQFIWHGGEPYLIKRFRQFIDTFETERNPNLTFGFTSNGTMLTATELRKLGKFPGINASISVDSFHKETFEKIRKGADFDKVLDNLLRAIATYAPPEHVFSVGMIVCKSNFLELPQNLAFAISHDIPLNLSPVVVYPVTEQLNLFENYELQTRGWHEALAQATQLVQEALEEKKPSVMRINPTGMLNELNSILDSAEQRYRNQCSLEFIVTDIHDSLKEMTYPGIYLYNQLTKSVVAYCEITPGKTRHLVRIPHGYSTNNVYWAVTDNLREIIGDVVAGWFEKVEKATGEASFEGNSWKPTRIDIPRYVATPRQKNIFFANYGETSPKGLNVRYPEQIYLAYKLKESKERLKGKGRGVHGWFEYLQLAVFVIKGHYKLFMKKR